MRLNKKWALLYGILLGDGCLSRPSNKRKAGRFISITGGFDDKPFYNSVVVPLISSLRNKETKFRERFKYGKIEINFTDKILFEKLHSLGFPIGKKGKNIKIPNFFHNLDLLKYLVQGYFATDGSVVLTKNPNKLYPRLEIHGISFELIMQVKDYLEKSGLKGNFYKNKRKKKTWKNAQNQYRFQFNGVKNLKLFKNEVGFVNPKHLEKFSKFLRYSKLYDDKMKGVPTKQQRFFREEIKM